MKLLLDTNILLDYYLRRQPYFNDCIVLRVMHEFGDAELWASAKSFTAIFYVASKYLDNAKLQKAFVASMDFLQICSLEKEDILAAANESWHDFEDCLIYYAAKKIKADAILSRDKIGFEKTDIAIHSPKEFIELVEARLQITYEIAPLTDRLSFPVGRIF